jgi:hypothetical protein
VREVDDHAQAVHLSYHSLKGEEKQDQIRIQISRERKELLAALQKNGLECLLDAEIVLFGHEVRLGRFFFAFFLYIRLLFLHHFMNGVVAIGKTMCLRPPAAAGLAGLSVALSSAFSSSSLTLCRALPAINLEREKGRKKGGQQANGCAECARRRRNCRVLSAADHKLQQQQQQQQQLQTGLSFVGKETFYYVRLCQSPCPPSHN